MIKLIEVCELLNASNSSKQKYMLREIFINPKHIIALREEPNYKQKLLEKELPKELDMRQEFTRLTLNRGHSGLDIVVVGLPILIEEKIKGARHVLHG